MTGRDWEANRPVLGMFLNGDGIPQPGPRGEPIVDDSFLVLFNAHHEDCAFTLPNRRFGERWALELSTAGEGGELSVDALGELTVGARSVMLLRRVA